MMTAEGMVHDAILKAKRDARSSEDELRDALAGQAMAALIITDKMEYAQIVNMAYKIADMMLIEKDK